MESRRLGKHRRQMMQSGLMCTLLSPLIDQAYLHFPKLPVQRGSLQLMKCRGFDHTFNTLSLPCPDRAPTLLQSQ
jgi:hypothetical protein